MTPCFNLVTWMSSGLGASMVGAGPKKWNKPKSPEKLSAGYIHRINETGMIHFFLKKKKKKIKRKTEAGPKVEEAVKLKC